MENPIGNKRLLQPAASLTGNGYATDFKGTTKNLSIYIVGGAAVTAGEIQLESAHDPAYTGTWAPHGSPVVVVADTVKIVQVTGALGAVRARISTTVDGGGVTVYAYAN